jgi:hypothetical protein
MIVLVLGIKVLMERLMFSFEPALLAAPRTSGMMLTIESSGLSVQFLMALLMFLVKLVMDPTMLPPAVMSKGQGSSKQQPCERQDGKGDFLQMGRHEMVSFVPCKVATTPIAGIWRERSLSVWRCTIVDLPPCQSRPVRSITRATMTSTPKRPEGA